MLFHQSRITNIKGRKIKKEEGNRHPGLTHLRLLNFGDCKKYKLWRGGKGMGRSLTNKVGKEQLSQLNRVTFRVVKLWLQSKGSQHKSKQSWKLPQLHSRFTSLLSKSLCDLSKHSGGWHQSEDGMSPPRPPWFVARFWQLPMLIRVVLSIKPHPAEKCFFMELAGKADGGSRIWWERNAHLPVFSLGTVLRWQDTTSLHAVWVRSPRGDVVTKTGLTSIRWGS